MKSKDVRVVLCTCPPNDASRIAKTLLEEKMVACVNVVAGVRSMYRWKNKVTEDAESLLVIKTPERCYDTMAARLQQIHPYEVPEVLSLDVNNGSDTYISWVNDSVAC